MKVFKFGGASLRHAEAIRNVATIIGLYRNEKIFIVASAMGKTTNALERIVNELMTGGTASKAISDLRKYHVDIINDLFTTDDPVFPAIDEEFERIPSLVDRNADPDFVYDQVVSLGEIVSTKILAAFLQKKFKAEWLDARTLIRTDSNFREGRVDWNETRRLMSEFRNAPGTVIKITQGFIGGDASGRTTTLGREGSDYTAAIVALCLDAESVTIWKDVPGVMNADPKRLPDAKVFEELPYQEAAEMTYYGASVIHPKTIKPLANKNIPLLVRSFDNPSLDGTRIHKCTIADLPPLVVFKDNQCLISCKVTDYTFIDEQHLSIIFQTLAKFDVRINMMQNSAISFSVCVDYRENKIEKLINELGSHFEVYYNTGLTLITVKNYDNNLFNEYRTKPGIILEQSSRSTLQVLLRA